MYEWYERADVKQPNNQHFRLEVNRNSFDQYIHRLPRMERKKFLSMKMFDFNLDFVQMNFGEFCEFLVPMITGYYHDRQIRQIFEKLDSNNDNYLNPEELESLLYVIGRPESRFKIPNYISRITPRGKLNFNGKLSINIS